MTRETVNGFGRVLIEQGIISPEQYKEADSVARETSSTVADALVKLGHATGDEVMQAIAKVHRLHYVDLTNVEIPEHIIELVPESVARENTILPLDEIDDALG